MVLEHLVPSVTQTWKVYVPLTFTDNFFIQFLIQFF